MAAVVLVTTFGGLRLAGLTLVGLLLTLFVATVAYLSPSDDGTTARVRNTILIVCAALGLQSMGSAVLQTYAAPGSWDFLVFHTDGHVVASGLNPYLPASYHEIFDRLEIPVALDPEFRREILDVAFKYAPPAMLLMLPLGWLSFGAGLALWLGIFIVAAAAWATWLMYSRLSVGGDRLGAAGMAATLVSTIPASGAVVVTEQTLFAGLAILLAMTASRNAIVNGGLAATVLVLKPLFILAPAYLFFSRQFKALMWTVLTFAAFCLLAALVTGLEPLRTYVGGEFVSRVPRFQYTQPINQSLLPFLLRNFSAPGMASPLARMDFWIVSGVVMSTTGFAALVAQRDAQQRQLAQWVLPVLVAGALLLYPGTLKSYGVLLLVAAVPLLTHARDQIVNASWSSRLIISGIVPVSWLATVVAAFVTVVAALQVNNQFAATCIVWVASVAMIFARPRRPAVQQEAGGTAK